MTWSFIYFFDRRDVQQESQSIPTKKTAEQLEVHVFNKATSRVSLSLWGGGGGFTGIHIFAVKICISSLIFCTYQYSLYLLIELYMVSGGVFVVNCKINSFPAKSTQRWKTVFRFGFWLKTFVDKLLLFYACTRLCMRIQRDCILKKIRRCHFRWHLPNKTMFLVFHAANCIGRHMGWAVSVRPDFFVRTVPQLLIILVFSFLNTIRDCIL